MRVEITIFSCIDYVVGLGLAVVAGIVEHLDRQLRVDSRIGGGSCFCFLLLSPVSDPNAFH